jgi:hypothetical protein
VLACLLAVAVIIGLMLMHLVTMHTCPFWFDAHALRYHAYVPILVCSIWMGLVWNLLQFCSKFNGGLDFNECKNLFALVLSGSTVAAFHVQAPIVTY